jgi:hypothetical protein
MAVCDLIRLDVRLLLCLSSYEIIDVSYLRLSALYQHCDKWRDQNSRAFRHLSEKGFLSSLNLLVSWKFKDLAELLELGPFFRDALLCLIEDRLFHDDSSLILNITASLFSCFYLAELMQLLFEEILTLGWKLSEISKELVKASLCPSVSFIPTLLIRGALNLVLILGEKNSLNKLIDLNLNEFVAFEVKDRNGGH